jgi:type I restriction enzyme, S subunit
MEIENLLQIPETWIRVNLKILAKDIYRYPTFYGMKHLEQGVPVIRGEHINDDGTISQDWSNYWFITHDLSQQFPRTILEPNDLVMSVRGTIGKIGLVNQKLNKAQISPNCIKIALYQNYCLPKFFLFYLKSFSGQRNINLVTSSTTINTIKASSLSETPIPLPPLNEQRRIVAKIEALKARSQTAKEALEEIPPLLDQFRQSVLAAAFRGDLTADWRSQHPDVEPASVLLERIQEKTAEHKHKRIDNALPDPFELPDKWGWISLFSICTSITDGDHQAPPKSNEGVPFLVISNISNGKLDFGNTRYVPENYYQSIQEHRKVRRGDLLYSVVGSYGIPILVDTEEKFCFQRHIALLKPSSWIISKYLLYALKSDFVFRQATEVATGTAQLTVTLSGLRKIKLPLISLSEQKEIVCRIEALFKAADRIEQQYQEAKPYLAQLDQSILAKAFRGELVPQDPNDEPASVLLERIQAEREKREAAAKAAKKFTGKTTGQRSRKAKQQDSESIQLGLPGLE